MDYGILEYGRSSSHVWMKLMLMYRRLGIFVRFEMFAVGDLLKVPFSVENGSSIDASMTFSQTQFFL